MRTPRHQFVALPAAAAVAVVLATGCGSSKPAYCSDRSKLEQSVKNISVTSGISSLKTQLQDVQTNAQALVSSAKSDFPDETSAIDNAVTKLKSDIAAITSSPSPAQLATTASDTKSLLDAVSSFVSASKSKCS
jgi:signal transduction protein with GAF and PtsI domain